MARLGQRVARDDGLTLVELLLVLTIIGILLAIAVPAYLALTGRANQTAAKEDVRTALPAVEAYYADCGKYADAAAAECSDGIAHTFDAAGLKKYAPGLNVLVVKSVGAGTGYCIGTSVGGTTASSTGPGGAIAATACP
jgi:prepilin-type N-terminal cleavage/methylation domain-containing protein